MNICIDNIVIRKAIDYDYEQICRLAHSHIHEVGFTPYPKIREVIRNGSIIVAVDNHQIVGYQIYRHLKKKSQTTLYSKVVKLEFRNKGIGKALVNALKSESIHFGKSCLLLKCVVDMPSNEFHKKVGFICIGIENGKLRPLNIYKLELTNNHE